MKLKQYYYFHAEFLEVRYVTMQEMLYYRSDPSLHPDFWGGAASYIMIHVPHPHIYHEYYYHSCYFTLNFVFLSVTEAY